jgi:hypothetical protein
VLAHLHWARCEEKLTGLAAVFLLDHVASEHHLLTGSLLQRGAQHQPMRTHRKLKKIAKPKRLCAGRDSALKRQQANQDDPGDLLSNIQRVWRLKGERLFVVHSGTICELFDICVTTRCGGTTELGADALAVRPVAHPVMQE